MRELKELIRENIYNLKPYSSARDEYKGKNASVFLDANENPFNTLYNRYPDPLQTEVKSTLSKIKGVDADKIFLGNGSDEAIDLIFRVFCTPAIDNVVAIEPTYGMYRVCADINNVEYRMVELDKEFQPDVERVLNSCDNNTKAIFLCSPNNPTGNLLERERILQIVDRFSGIVVVDEAYIDFAPTSSLVEVLDRYPNLILLQTLSKAWGMAAIRMGIAFASEAIISFMNRVKYPYNINILTQQAAIERLHNISAMKIELNSILEERTSLEKELSQLPLCQKIFPSHSNFILIRVKNATNVYQYLMDNGTIVRNRSHITLCNDCLRITIGTPTENMQLIKLLKEYRYE